MERNIAGITEIITTRAPNEAIATFKGWIAESERIVVRENAFTIAVAEAIGKLNTLLASVPTNQPAALLEKPIELLNSRKPAHWKDASSS